MMYHWDMQGILVITSLHKTDIDVLLWGKPHNSQLQVSIRKGLCIVKLIMQDILIRTTQR